MSGRGGLGFLDISENRLASRDRERDLAVLEIPVSHVRRQGKLFSTWNTWPPPRPAVGMPALIYGYPGEGRVPLGDSLGIRPLTMGRYVASVTDRHFSLADIHGDSEMRTPEGATPITSYGGISGSAVYIIQSNSESFLAGFVYEAAIPAQPILRQEDNLQHVIWQLVMATNKVVPLYTIYANRAVNLIKLRVYIAKELLLTATQLS